MELLVVEQIVEYLLAVLQPHLGTDESFDVDFGVQGGCPNRARVQLDVGLNKISAEVAPPAAVEQLQELFGDCMVGRISFDDGFHDLPIDWGSDQGIIVKIAS